MNLVIVDGRICTAIAKQSDSRRLRARFLVSTKRGEEIPVEVRGEAVERMISSWQIGDSVHLQGRITSAGYVAADSIRRLAGPPAHETVQLSWHSFSQAFQPAA